MLARNGDGVFVTLIEYFSLGNIEKLLSIIGKATSLLPDFRPKDEVIFDEIVDPVFIEFQEVFDDYLMMFTSAIDDLSKASTQEDYRAATDNLLKNRTAMLANRVAIREHASELIKISKNKKLNGFLESVVSAFFAVEADPNPQKMSRSLGSYNLLDLLSSIEEMQAGYTKDQVVEALRASRTSIEKSFISAAQAHAHFRIHAKKSVVRAARRH